MNKLRCAVIGANGFLGAEIVKYLISKGDEVVCFDRVFDNKELPDVEKRTLDITDRLACESELTNFEEVYNIAGVLGTSELNEAVHLAIKVNVLGAINVFDACEKNKVKRVFYPAKPNEWLNTYTITKEASEKFTEIYNEKCETKFIRVRWYNAYGPGQHTHPVRKIGPTFCLLARHGLPQNIFGSGENKMDLIYSSDIAKWSVEATRNNLYKKVYQLGRGVAVTVNDFAQDLNDLVGNTAGVNHVPMREGEIDGVGFVADITDLKKDLKDVGLDLEFSDWNETLLETYNYYKEQIDEETSMEILKFHGLIQDNE